MSKSLARVKAALSAAGLPVQVLECAVETRTAEQAAEAAGCDLDQIVKSMLFQGAETGRFFLFLTAGGHQVEAGRAGVLAQEPLGRADPGRVRAVTGFAIGGVSPLGHLQPVTQFIDPRLLDFPLVWAAAGTPRHILAIDPVRLMAVTGAIAGDFAVPKG